MQRVVDVWQKQANTSQQDLVTAMQKLEDLRAKNSKLTQEFVSLQDSKHALTEELNERNVELQGYVTNDLVVSHYVLLACTAQWFKAC